METQHPDLDRIALEEIEEELLQARHDLFVEHGAIEQELDSIEAEREIEFEELAQEEQTAEIRTRLSQQQFAQLRQIDGALERISRGVYGMCLDCGQPIAIERLRAQPSAALCAACTEQQEGRPEPPQGRAQDRPQDYRIDTPDLPAETDEHAAGAPLPPELAALDDNEMAETIRDAFRNEVGDALDSVRVLCRDGVAILAGEVPNEALPEIARRIVEDELGYEVVDRLLITELAGGPDKARRRVGQPHQVDQRITEAFGGDDIDTDTSEDILEVDEEGLTFVPPTRPVPER